MVIFEFLFVALSVTVQTAVQNGEATGVQWSAAALDVLGEVLRYFWFTVFTVFLITASILITHLVPKQEY